MGCVLRREMMASHAQVLPYRCAHAPAALWLALTADCGSSPSPRRRLAAALPQPTLESATKQNCARARDPLVRTGSGGLIPSASRALYAPALSVTRSPPHPLERGLFAGLAGWPRVCVVSRRSRQTEGSAGPLRRGREASLGTDRRLARSRPRRGAGPGVVASASIGLRAVLRGPGAGSRR
jgi:hypothetical protein